MSDTPKTPSEPPTRPVQPVTPTPQQVSPPAPTPKVEAAQPQQQAQPQPTHQPTPQRPADTLRDGAVKATIWERQGDRGQFYATDLSRTYKDQEGNLRDSRSFSGSDLLRVSELAKGAYHRTNELRREHAQTRRTDVENDPNREARREAHRSERTSSTDATRETHRDR